jgi:hypothetical protein
MPQIRNEYVHELKVNVTQFERNFMSFVAANVIRYIMQRSSKLRNRDELELFLELVSIADLERLKSHERMANLAYKEVQDHN